MTSFDCPICGGSQSIELITAGGEARCRECSAPFVIDGATLIMLGQTRKVPAGLDPDFDLIPKKGKPSAKPGLSVAIAVLSLMLLLLVLLGASWVSARPKEIIEGPSAVDELSITVEDARPAAAAAPIVDPSSFRRPELDRR